MIIALRQNCCVIRWKIFCNYVLSFICFQEKYLLYYFKIRLLQLGLNTHIFIKRIKQYSHAQMKLIIRQDRLRTKPCCSLIMVNTIDVIRIYFWVYMLRIWLHSKQNWYPNNVVFYNILQTSHFFKITVPAELKGEGCWGCCWMQSLQFTSVMAWLKKSHHVAWFVVWFLQTKKCRTSGFI